MPVHLTCLTCGDSYSRKPSGVRQQNFCSLRCRHHYAVSLSDDGQSARIPIRAQDGSVRAYALIDAADAEWVCQWRWSLSSRGYVYRGEQMGGFQRSFFLHRELMGLTNGDQMTVDHINRDRLDNRRVNLRRVTQAQNSQNLPARKNSTSSYRGVSWAPKERKWLVQMYIDGKNTRLGVFTSEVEAAEFAAATRKRVMPFSVD